MGICQGSETKTGFVEDLTKETSPASSPAKSPAKSEPRSPGTAPPAEETEEREDTTQPADAPRLTVAIMGARGLRNADCWFAGKSDCFCVVKAVGKDTELVKTQVMCDTLEPVWNEEVDIVEYQDGEALEFSVWDADLGDRRDSLGKVVMNSDMIENGFNNELQLVEAGKGITAWLRVKVKKAGREYPLGPPVEVLVEVEKDSKKDKLGLDIDMADSRHLYVTGITPGPLKAYNAGAKPEAQIKSGDFIVSANGVEGDCNKILETMVREDKLRLVVRRPEEIQVAIEKKGAGQALGLEFPKNIVKGQQTLLIKKISDGPFKSWNDANSNKEVQEGDRIVAVGSFRGGAAEIKKRLGKEAKFQCTVVRPAHHTQSWWYW